jgi:hypothetical protein
MKRGKWNWVFSRVTCVFFGGQLGMNIQGRLDKKSEWTQHGTAVRVEKVAEPVATWEKGNLFIGKAQREVVTFKAKPTKRIGDMFLGETIPHLPLDVIDVQCNNGSSYAVTREDTIKGSEIQELLSLSEECSTMPKSLERFKVKK